MTIGMISRAEIITKSISRQSVEEFSAAFTSPDKCSDITTHLKLIERAESRLYGHGSASISIALAAVVSSIYMEKRGYPEKYFIT